MAEVVDNSGEARFRGLLEAAPDAMVCVDPDGRISLVNAQAERLFGYDRSELIGELVELLVPESAHAVHPAHRARYGDEPTPRPMGAGMELAGRRRDGTEFPAEISLSAIDTPDGVLVSAAIRDVTERIEAQAERERLKSQAERERFERQLHQSQRLESLGQLAGGVAHDFNNLLLVIRNFASFVSDEITAAMDGHPPGDWAPVRADADQIIAAADRAALLTHQLLAFGRREVVHPRPVVLNDVVADVEQLLRRALGEYVELSTSLSPDLWRTMADPGRLEQVLVNLVVNARDAMPDGGRLHVQTSNVELNEEDVADLPTMSAGRHIRLQVSDTGSGMDRRVLERAFEPFFTTKPKGEGSGLGLATVYGIIAQAGGDVRIRSEPGSGTTVTALFPATDEVVTVDEPEPVPVAASGTETVLLVEDEAAVRELTRRILEKHGYRVIVAANGHAAVDIASDPTTEAIDVLLTDVVMPQMLGTEVAERVTALRPSTHVVYMSGFAESVVGARGTIRRGVTLLEKPFNDSTLLSTLRKVLSDVD